ncbi:MAG: hypothetical protein QF926_05580 [Alphaproteobacteria bacterium]|nr:hypothetical protein [Alphaproteobacteria bacterium]MDP6516078.1 hypothetical protein [Alphaproteobacteria bacterium]
MTARLRAALHLAIVALVVAIAAAGCGRKGPPVPPGEDEPELRRGL